MDKISSFSVCFWGIESIAVIFFIALRFYKSVPMWILTFLIVLYSVIHIYMYYLQKRNETVKLRRFQKLRLGAMILLIGWILGAPIIAAQCPQRRSFKEMIELWVERIKAD